MAKCIINGKVFTLTATELRKARMTNTVKVLFWVL